MPSSESVAFTPVISASSFPRGPTRLAETSPRAADGGEEVASFGCCDTGCVRVPSVGRERVNS